MITCGTNNEIKKEPDYGNVEYKIKLINKTEDRINQLVTQMRFRVSEGNGEAIYCIGVTDEGILEGINNIEFEETYNCLIKIAKKNNYNLTLLSKKNIIEDKYVYEILVREINNKEYIDIKVAVAGSVDSGKSTTMSILTNGVLDDGRGSARMSIFNYRHEMKSGRTSSIAHHILGFDIKGNITNYCKFGKPSWTDIVSKSHKIISFLDLCGHEKYLKTTISGLASSHPDLCLIIVGANMGVTRITREHIFLCVSLKIPFSIIITKIDICKNRLNILNETKKSINKILRLPNIRRIPYKISEMDDVILCSKKIHTNSYVPIFHTSNTTGEGIDLVKEFLNLLPRKKRKKNPLSNVELYIDSIFKVNGVGNVIGGHLLGGTINIGDRLLLGPNNNTFSEIIIKSIHCKRVSVSSVTCGKYVCLGIKKIDRKNIRKGQVVISGIPKNIREFDAEVIIMKSTHTTIKEGYQPVIHTGNIRQSASIISIHNKINSRLNENDEEKILRTGDRAIVKFRFLYKGEYIKKGMILLMAEGKIKIVGIVRRIYE